jgi:signal peptidase I
MAPNLLQGDHVLVTKLGPHNSEWKRGDVVAFVNPHGEDVWVKRVVGIAGDAVKIENGNLSINGLPADRVPCDEPSLVYTELVLPHADEGPDAVKEALEKGAQEQRGLCFFESLPEGPTHRVLHIEKGLEEDPQADGKTTETTVPKGMVYVLGDNRFNSQDSRAFGPIHLESVQGRVHSIFYSINPGDGAMRAGRIGLKHPEFDPS